MDGWVGLKLGIIALESGYNYSVMISDVVEIFFFFHFKKSMNGMGMGVNLPRCQMLSSRPRQAE